VDSRHQEYIAYYRARVRRVASSPLYPHTLRAEKAILEAIETAPDLETFQERLESERLNVACATARVRDENQARADLLLELEETVRAQPHLEILRALEGRSLETVEDLNTLVTDVETRWQLRISEDETLLTDFWSDWKIMEDIEQAEQSVVPPRWHEERARSVVEERARGKQDWEEHTLPNARKYFPEYNPDWEQLWETRHRRKLPFSDAVVERMITNHKRYTGVL